MAVSIPNNVNTFQNNWRFCNHCYSMWWNGRPDNGACPSGNSPDGQHHGQGSWNFYHPSSSNETI